MASYFTRNKCWLDQHNNLTLTLAYSNIEYVLFYKQCIANFKRWQDTFKLVSATFLLVCFLHLKESTCETKKNVFYFTLKALFVLEIIKF